MRDYLEKCQARRIVELPGKNADPLYEVDEIILDDRELVKNGDLTVDLSRVRVAGGEGWVLCLGSDLTTLEKIPAFIDGPLNCASNKLETLDSLRGKKIHGTLCVTSNPLTPLLFSEAAIFDGTAARVLSTVSEIIMGQDQLQRLDAAVRQRGLAAGLGEREESPGFYVPARNLAALYDEICAKRTIEPTTVAPPAHKFRLKSAGGTGP